MGRFFDGMETAEILQKTQASVGIQSGISFGISEETSERKTKVVDAISSQFRRITLDVVERHDNRSLVMVIDELDRLKDKTALASIVKACAHIKFILVGVADDLNELLLDHASVDRQFSEGVIAIPRMTKQELRGVIRRGEDAMNGTLRFSDDAADFIAGRAGGFPHFVHLLAKEAARVCSDRKDTRVTILDVEAAVKDIVKAQKAPKYESLYQKAVKGSPQSEIVLRAFADDPAEDVIFTRPVYALCKELGVENPAQSVGTLVQREILENASERHYYKFVDPLLRVYVRLRQFKFRG